MTGTTPDPGTTARDALAARIRAILTTHDDVRETSMFGVLAFMVDGRMAVSAGRDGSLLVRIVPADRDALLERGAEPAHMANGRPMGAGWLTVPAARIGDDVDLGFWITVGREAGRKTGT